ncbi:3-deoxy-manno-octulosonate cytidylyltransferase [Pseudomonadota bacterium]
MKNLIIIPARYGSTRLPGKPLMKIAGKTMLQRVYEIAKKASEESNCEVIVATENEEIKNYAESIGAKCVMTSESCKTGTDRAAEVLTKIDYKPDFVINLQGDAPLTPPLFIKAMLDEVEKNSSIDVITPVIQLSWAELDKLRESKKTTPFSGTTAIIAPNNDAIWFSKNIIPAIRKEEKYRGGDKFSPIHRHIGLYGYSYNMLKKYATIEESYYEKFEGLEQLRFIENGYKVRIVKVSYEGRESTSGVDTLEDIKRTEAFIKKYGEIIS